MIFEMNQPYLISHFSRVIPHGILRSSSLNRSKFILLKSKVGILLFTLIAPLRILNTTISWTLQPTANMPNQFFFVYKDQVQQTTSLHQQNCPEFISPVHSRKFLDCDLLCWPSGDNGYFIVDFL